MSLYGLLNARWIRIRRITESEASRPEPACVARQHGAGWLSDLHLGNVIGSGFSRRMAKLAASLNPEIVFFPGDLFDGVKADPDQLIAPFRRISPPFGVFYSSGNHDEFGDEARFEAALTRAGIRVLNNEKVTWMDSRFWACPTATPPARFACAPRLEGLRLDPSQASILLNHMPSRLPIVEHAGISLRSQAIPTVASCSRSTGSRGASSASSPMDCNGLARFRSTHRAALEPGVRRCGWEPTPEIVLITFDLERFPEFTCPPAGIVLGGIFLRKMPLEFSGFAVYRL